MFLMLPTLISLRWFAECTVCLFALVITFHFMFICFKLAKTGTPGNY